MGAAAGGLLGKELGHGKLATLGGLVAGAYGAHELERRVEKHREKKRMEEPYGERKDREREKGGHRRRRSSGGLVDNIKEKVEGFLNQQQEGGEREREREKRRSRSHAGTGGGRRGGRDDYDDSSDDERYERRSTKGSRRERDDYY